MCEFKDVNKLLDFIVEILYYFSTIFSNLIIAVDIGSINFFHILFYSSDMVAFNSSLLDITNVLLRILPQMFVL